MAQEGYRVLARKYRPQTFDDLIGQEPMVRTLQNAFELGRIAQAYMLTGVRGVGKTTTARIIARGLNYESEDGSLAAPTVTMPALGKHCQAIIESRHVDVIEMDAASHTGIDDIRDIIESTQYRPASARYKVFIIDEVHMLSKAAFNGLLKTLEEPPSHVKFIFATTEIRKVPVTVLSRCQRFDLRRVPQELLSAHFTSIAQKEGVSLDEDAALAISRAAEGSVRDGLSLLDQAIAQGADTITLDAVNTMLGLADQGRVIDLFAALVKGDAPLALEILAGLYEVGADPLTVLNDLALLTHAITRHRVSPDAGRKAGLDEATLKACETYAASLSLPVLSRFWQMVLKGIEEVGQSSLPLAATEMVLIRLAYVAEVPTPDDLVKMIEAGGGAVSATKRSSSVPQPSNGGAPSQGVNAQGANALKAQPETLSATAPQLAKFSDIVALAREKRDLKLALELENFVEPIKLEANRLELRLSQDAPVTLVGELGQKLSAWTGTRFMVTLAGRSEKPLRTVAAEREEAFVSEVEAVKSDPLVQSLLQHFPDAVIMDVRRPDTMPSPLLPIRDNQEDDTFFDEASDDDDNGLL